LQAPTSGGACAASFLEREQISMSQNGILTWGAYAMIVLAIITYALPNMTGRNLHDSKMNVFAFWASNIGMIFMTIAFGIAGIAQVYLERKMGLDFLSVQKEIEIHFAGLALAACVFTLGVGAFIWNFIRFGMPKA
jgi:nitric oxide reductase subunit B